MLFFPPLINTSSWNVLPAAKPSQFALSFTDKMKHLFPLINNWVRPHYLQSGCRCQAAAYLQPPSPAAVVCLSVNCSQGLHRNQGGEAECTVSTHRKHKPCTAVAPLCLSSRRRSLCLASSTEHGHSFIPQKWCEMSPCYNSVLIKWCYHNNKICCCPFIPCQSICVYSPFCNHWTWVSSGKKSVRTKIRKDYIAIN